MFWYVFDLTGFPEPLHSSLTRAFMRQARREGPAGNSHLFAARLDHEPIPVFYYLHTPDERPFARMIRQFGGRRSAQPSVGLQEIKREGDFRAPTPEVDSTAC